MIDYNDTSIAAVGSSQFARSGWAPKSARDRQIEDGSLYDKYFTIPNLTDDIAKRDGSVEDTVVLMKKIILTKSNQVEKLAKEVLASYKLDGKLNVYETVENIFWFVFRYIKYNLEEGEQLQTPRHTWYQAQILARQNPTIKNSADCDCMAIFCGSCMYELGIPFDIKIAGYSSGNYQHVYCVAYDNQTPIICDPVTNYFNYEKPPVIQKSYKITPKMALSGNDIHILDGTEQPQPPQLKQGIVYREEPDGNLTVISGLDGRRKKKKNKKSAIQVVKKVKNTTSDIEPSDGAEGGVVKYVKSSGGGSARIFKKLRKKNKTVNGETDPEENDEEIGTLGKKSAKKKKKAEKKAAKKQKKAEKKAEKKKKKVEKKAAKKEKKAEKKAAKKEKKAEKKAKKLEKKAAKKGGKKAEKLKKKAEAVREKGKIKAENIKEKAKTKTENKLKRIDEKLKKKTAKIEVKKLKQSGASKSEIKEAKKKLKQVKKEIRKARKEDGRGFFRKIGNAVKSGAMLPVRGAFLALLRLNFRGLATRFYENKEAYDKFLKKWKKVFGGKEARFKLAITTGQVHKPLFGSKKTNKKIEEQAAQLDNGTPVEGLFGLGLGSLGIEPTTTAAAAWAAVASSALSAAVGVLKKLGVNVPESLEDAVEAGQDVAEMLEDMEITDDPDDYEGGDLSQYLDAGMDEKSAKKAAKKAKKAEKKAEKAASKATEKANKQAAKDQKKAEKEKRKADKQAAKEQKKANKNNKNSEDMANGKFLNFLKKGAETAANVVSTMTNANNQPLPTVNENAQTTMPNTTAPTTQKKEGWIKEHPAASALIGVTLLGGIVFGIVKATSGSKNNTQKKENNDSNEKLSAVLLS